LISLNESKIANGSRTEAVTGRSESSTLCRADDAPRAAAEPIHGPDALGEIYLRHLSVADLRDSNPNIFYGVRARYNRATFVGRAGILVLLVGRDALVDRVCRFATANLALRFRTRVHACCLGLANARPRHSFSRRSAVRPCRH